MTFLGVAQGLGGLGEAIGQGSLINQDQQDRQRQQAFQQYLETQRLGLDVASVGLRQKEYDASQKKANQPSVNLETRPDGSVWKMTQTPDGNITAEPFTGFPPLIAGQKPDIDKITEFLPPSLKDTVRQMAKAMPSDKALAFISSFVKDDDKSILKNLSDFQQLREDFKTAHGRYPNLEEDEQLRRKSSGAGQGAPGETIKDRKGSFATLSTTHNENWTKAFSEYNSLLAKHASEANTYQNAVKEWEKASHEHYILGAGPKPVFQPTVSDDDVLAAKNKLALASEARNYINSNRDNFVLRGGMDYEDLYGRAEAISNLPVPVKRGEKAPDDVLGEYVDAFGGDADKARKMLITVGYQ